MRVRRSRVGLLALGAVVAAVAAAPALTGTGDGPDPYATSRVLWSADTETGDLSQWTAGDGGGVYVTGSGKVTVDDTVAHSGRYSLRFTITGADGTTGNQATRIFRWATADGAPLPDEAYYSAWYRFPRTWRPIEFWNVFQWKTRISEDRIDPTFILDVGNAPDGAMRLSAWDWIAGVERGESPIDLPVARWVHIEARLRWSERDDGSLTVWQDGRKVIDVRRVRTEYPSDAQYARDWSLDDYTNGIDPPDATINVDDAVISLDRVGPGSQPVPAPAPADPEAAPAPGAGTPPVTAGAPAPDAPRSPPG